MARTVLIIEWAALVLFLGVPAVLAQNSDSELDATPGQYNAPYPAMVSWASSAETPVDPEQLTPDQRPLTGVQGLTLGQYSETHSFLLPTINATTQLEMNPPGSGYDRLSSVSYFLGRVDLHRVSNRSELVVDYAGGGMFSNYGNNGNGNAAIQDLEFSENIRWQRWSLLVGDETSYLSESPFGFGGVGGLGFLGGLSQTGPGGVLGGTLPLLNTPLIPGETIPTANVPRLSNAAVSQVEYRLSPRSTWTAAGSYGLLEFFGAGYINSSDALFQTGYNYQVSPVSSFGVLYRFDRFQFMHLAQGIDDHLVELSYGRQITGRLSFQIAAGPEMQIFDASLANTSSQVSWTLGSSLNYQLRRNALSLGYDHLLTAGSGVLVGAETDQAQASVARNLSQTWLLLVSLGYAHNRVLTQTSADAVQPLFNSWYGAVQVNHQLWPGTSLFISYGANLQGMNAATCSALNCGANYVTQQISLGFNWGLRPIGLH